MVGKEKKTMKQVVLSIAKQLKIKKVIFKKNSKDHDHYIVNPYTYEIRSGKLLKPKKPIKFEKGIKLIIEDEKKLLTKKIRR